MAAIARSRGQVRRWRPQPLVAVALVPTLLVFGLLAIVVWISLRVNLSTERLTLEHYRSLFADSLAVSAMVNSLVFTAVATTTSFAIGLPIAWFLERTDLRGKRLAYTCVALGIFMPGFFSTMGWVLLLHPRIGIGTSFLRDTLHVELPFSILSVGGMGFIQGFGLAGLVVMFTAASLRSMDVSLQEAASMSGASPFQAIRRVLVPLARPGTLSALVFLVALNLSAFDVPLLIGVPNRIYTFSTFLLTTQSRTTDGLPPYGLTAAFGVQMLLLAIALTWCYRRLTAQARRYAVITGKTFRSRVQPLGRWRGPAHVLVFGYFAVALLVPLLLLVWTALSPYFQPISAEGFGNLSLDNFSGLPWDLVRRGLLNTALLMVLVPLVGFMVSIAISWTAIRRRGFIARSIDFASFMPMAVPPVIFAFAALLAVLNLHLPLVVDLYGTLTLLVVVYVISSLGFMTRTTGTALIQIHEDLEDAAKLSGASPIKVIRRVVVPLVAPTLLYGALWISLLVYRDITVATVLTSRDNLTVSMVVWNLWNAGDLGGASAMNLVMLVALLPLVVLYLRRAGSSGLLGVGG